VTLVLAIGYLATALNVAGNLLLAAKSRTGWILRLATNAAFLCYSIPVMNDDSCHVIVELVEKDKRTFP